MDVLTMDKSNIRSTERNVKRVISAIKRNNFGDKIAFRALFFVVGVIYLFFTYGALYSGTIPENQDFSEKTKILENLWVKIIEDTGLIGESDYVYIFFGGFFLTLFACIILYPFIRKIFKAFYIEKKIKPIFDEYWKNLVELRYKLGNAFHEYNIFNDAITAVCLYYFSSVVFTSVYCFNCFSFKKAILYVFIASVIGVICYTIEVALFILADGLFYDSNKKMIHFKYEFDCIWLDFTRNVCDNTLHYLYEKGLLLDCEKMIENYQNSKEDFINYITEMSDEKIKDEISYEELLFFLWQLNKNVVFFEKTKEKHLQIEEKLPVYKELKEILFNMFYEAVKENKTYEKYIEKSKWELEKQLDILNRKAVAYVIDEEEYRSVVCRYKEIMRFYVKSYDTKSE